MILNYVKRCAAMLLLASMLGSCSLMHDDLADCAVQPKTRTAVSFIYDYNSAGKDLFPEEVGGLTLYVFDKDGKLLQAREQTYVTTDGSHVEASPVMLDLTPGDYTFYAVAHQSATYNASLDGPGAKFRRVDGFTSGSAVEEYLISLDHSAGNVDHRNTALEDLWMTREGQKLTVTEAPMPAEGDPQPEDVVLNVIVPLVRVTNHLDLTLIREFIGPGASMAPATRAGLDDALDINDYEVWIETGSSRAALDLTGKPAAASAPLRYTPYAKDPLTAQPDRIRTCFSTSALVYEADDAKADALCVKSRITGHVTRINLPKTLASALPAGSQWSAQEFLERHKDFEMTVAFNEMDNGWRYIDVNIPVLNWTKRIFNVDLK